MNGSTIKAIEQHIPIGVVLAVLLQTAGLVWWGSNITARMANIESDIVSQRAVMDSMQDVQQKRGERIAALEASQTAILSALQRIDTKLDASR